MTIGEYEWLVYWLFVAVYAWKCGVWSVVSTLEQVSTLLYWRKMTSKRYRHFKSPY